MNKRHKDIDLHANFHLAQLQVMAIGAKDSIAMKVNFHIRSMAQSRRWEFYRRVNRVKNG